MNWPGADVINGVPIVLAQGPPKRKVKHVQQAYYEDANGNLVIPNGGGSGRVRRSSFEQSSRPTSIVINNSQWEEASPERRSRRRSAHSTYDSDSYSDHSRSHSHDRRGHRRHSKHYHRESRNRTPDLEMEKRLERLKELEAREEEEEARKRFEEEKILEDARKAKKKKEEEDMKKAAIEEWKTKELEKELKEKAAKEEADRLYQARVRAEFAAKGYSEESITKFLKKEEKQHEKQYKKKEVMDLSRATFIKVDRKYLSPDTLDAYELPWEWDDVGSLPLLQLLRLSALIILPLLRTARPELHHHQAMDSGK